MADFPFEEIVELFFLVDEPFTTDGVSFVNKSSGKIITLHSMNLPQMDIDGNTIYDEEEIKLLTERIEQDHEWLQMPVMTHGDWHDCFQSFITNTNLDTIYYSVGRSIGRTLSQATDKQRYAWGEYRLIEATKFAMEFFKDNGISVVV